MNIIDKLKDSLGQRGSAKNFGESQKREEAWDMKDRGTKSVPLSRIVGSVGRYHDLDERFRFKSNVPSERYQRIKEAIRTGRPLPPIKLYQIKEEYYVLDGNHRVAAAKEYHWESIEATIMEFISSNNSLKDILYREKIDFIEKTGLPYCIDLTEVYQYHRLMRQLVRHREYLERERKAPVTIRAAAEDWYKLIYQPMVAIIEKSRLHKGFPDRTVSDLYMFISTHQWGKRKSREFSNEIDRLIHEDMETFRQSMQKRNENEYPEMTREVTVFVLMNVEPRREMKLIEKLFALHEVREIHSVHGNADLLIKVVLSRDWLASDAETISLFVHDRIRQLQGVVNTQTLIPGHSKIKEPLRKRRSDSDPHHSR